MAWNWENSVHTPTYPWRYGSELDLYPTDHPYYVYNDDEPVQMEFQSVPDRYELHDWQGNLLDSGACTLHFSLGVLPAGHYRVYFYKDGANHPVMGDAAGSMHISVWRRKAGMRDKPGMYGEPYVLGAMNATTLRLDPINDIDNLQAEIDAALQQKTAFETSYLDYPDAARVTKQVVVHFADGTNDPRWEAGVQQVVAAFGTENVWYECRNEPDTNTADAAVFVAELQQFHAYVKAANPNAKVLGPNQVSLNSGQLHWARAFFQNGGGNYIDGYSFHAYNMCSGELDRGRKNAQRMVDLLTEFGQQNKPRWMTEWGCFASTYGSFTPMRQLRWVMMDMLLWEQYGIPKERFYYFYERSHGFWDYPSFLITDTYGLYPAATAMRVFSEEVFGKAYAERLDFGDEDQDFIGSRYSGSNGDVIVLMACGRHGDDVSFTVSGAAPATLDVIDSMGASSTRLVSGGVCTIAVSGAPLYIRVPTGITLTTRPRRFGADLVRQGMWSVATSSTGHSGATRLTAGAVPDDYPYYHDAPLPITLTLKLGQMTTFDTVYIRGSQPWQVRSAILEGYVEVKNGASWERIGTIENSYRVKHFVTGWRDTNCYIETYYNERFSWCFTAPQTFRTDEVRLVVTQATWGGEVAEAGQFRNADNEEVGQGLGMEGLSLQGIEIYKTKHSTGGSGSSSGGAPLSQRVVIRKS